MPAAPPSTSGARPAQYRLPLWDYTIEPTDHGMLFRDPAGTIVSPAPPRPPLDPWQRTLGDPSISADSNRPGWDGWPVDYEMCVDSLAPSG